MGALYWRQLGLKRWTLRSALGGAVDEPPAALTTAEPDHLAVTATRSEQQPLQRNERAASPAVGDVGTQDHQRADGAAPSNTQRGRAIKDLLSVPASPTEVEPALLRPPAEVNQPLTDNLDKKALDAAAPTVVPDLANFSFEQLAAQIHACKACPLHATRTQAVVSAGAAPARLMLVGEAPEGEEDRLGEAFVGRAGTLLDQMLAAIELDRSAVYLTNVLKCRPPSNRDPRGEEVAACRRYLLRQVELVGPVLIVALGRFAAQVILDRDEAISRLRGTIHHPAMLGAPVMVTYHPAYLLRNPVDKARSWQDLRQAYRLLRGDGGA
ncbi:uracil-DNA glycosylase [Gammaproteobacteria bacterium]|nr:uracil-DNA glycosylase [Gammaproteobacteria bacterium]